MSTKPAYLISLEEVGYNKPITLNEMVERSKFLDNHFDEITSQEICELSLIEGIIDDPHSWGWFPEEEDNSVLQIDESTSLPDTEEQDQVNMATGGQTHKGVDYAGIPFQRREHASSSNRTRREQKLWNARIKSEPMEYDYERIISQQFDVDTSKWNESKPVSKEGIMLYCNNLSRAAIELEAWQSSIDIAIGANPTWSTENKLNYMENTLGGKAKLAWNSFKATPSYQKFLDSFNQSKGAGITIADALRLEICGRTDKKEEKQELQRKAFLKLQNMQCCTLDKLDEYNDAFSTLFWINGESANQELLALYWAKLPQPFGEEMGMKYKKLGDEKGTSKDEDTLGRRMHFVKSELAEFCRREFISQQSRKSLAKICGRYDTPELKFGCTKTTRKHRKKRKVRSRKKYIKTSKRSSKRKPKFFRKRKKKYAKKEQSKVKCFGCQEIGHYANKCPKRKAQFKMIEDDFGLLVLDDYLSDDISDSHSFYYETSSEESYYSTDSNEEV